jgi:heme o synthase
MATATIEHAQLEAPAAAAPWKEAPGASGERLLSTAGGRLLRIAGDYLALTKPRVMSLLVLTTVAAMIAGAEGLPRIGPLLATIAGGMLAAGGASAVNHVLDRDIDRLMGARTERRPVAAGRISPGRALCFGCVLIASALTLLAGAVNVLAAGLSLVGAVVYVFVYTLWLKRSTPQNIVIGGVAGAMPPLVGWAAATGTLAAPAWIMFAIVALWTPPHFWALALMLRRHYANAGVPMLPVVSGAQATARKIGLYSVLLFAVSLLPAAWPAFGVPYLACALILGAIQLTSARALMRDRSARIAARAFRFSLVYLALLFAALAATAALS